MPTIYTPSDFPEDHAEWLDNLRGDHPYGEGLEQLVEFSELGLGDPDTWTHFDVTIDSRGEYVDMSITDEFGQEYSVHVDVDLETDEWWWAWDIWEWLGDAYPDVDKDSEYVE